MPRIERSGQQEGVGCTGLEAKRAEVSRGAAHKSFSTLYDTVLAQHAGGPVQRLAAHQSDVRSFALSL